LIFLLLILFFEKALVQNLSAEPFVNGQVRLTSNKQPPNEILTKDLKFNTEYHDEKN